MNNHWAEDRYASRTHWYHNALGKIIGSVEDSRIGGGGPWYAECPKGTHLGQYVSEKDAKAAVEERVSLKHKVKLGATYRHTNSGGDYEVLYVAKHETTLELVVVYRNLMTQEVWVRPLVQFCDGRFELLHDRSPKT